MNVEILRVFIMSQIRYAGLLVLGVLLALPSWAAPQKSSRTPSHSGKQAAVSTVKQSIPDAEIKRFSAAINHIKRYYVKSVDDEKLFDNAIEGMLSGLDPHSTYLDEEAWRDLTISTRGKFAGVGVKITLEKGIIKVISPLDGSPAAKVGIKPGDYIVQIDKTPVYGMNLPEILKLMRGQPGTKVRLMVLRKGEKQPLYFNLKRAMVYMKSVKIKLLAGSYGYMRISYFRQSTYKEVLKGIKNLKRESRGHLKGLILDLRNNPGGLLGSAIRISDAFIHNDSKGKDELLVYTEGRMADRNFIALATPGDILNGMPIVVLINQGSASASEIVAGALQDNRRAIVVGMRSFGKGSVQTLLPLDNKRGIKLTTAMYYTPAGRSIQAHGVDPDILVKDLKVSPAERKPGSDLQESHLQGYLKTKVKPKSKQVRAREEEQSLLRSDYQLSQALNILKGMSITHVYTSGARGHGMTG